VNSKLLEDDPEQPICPGRHVGGDKKLTDALDDYLEQYEEKSSTWYRKKAALDSFISFHTSIGILFCAGVTQKSSSGHKKYLAKTPSLHTNRVKTPVTQRDTTVVVKHFLRHCYTFRFGVDSDVLHSYKLARYAKASVIVCTEAQFLDVLKIVDKYWDPHLNEGIKYLRPSIRCFHSIRLRTILAIQISTGLRISETLRMRCNDYDQSVMSLIIRETKSGRPRDVPVTQMLAVQIAAWLKVRPRKSPTDFLFVSDTGGQLGIRSCTAQYQRYLHWGRAHGYELPNLTMHSYRHKAITAINQSSPVHAQAIAGHSNIKTTMGYDHTTTESIRKTHAAVDPWTSAMMNAKVPQRPRGKKLA